MIAAIRSAANGIHLDRNQRNLLFFGLHAVAAARQTSVYVPFLELLHYSEQYLKRNLGSHFIETVTQVLLSVCNGNVEPLYELLENRRVDGSVKCALFMTLARLVWEERASRDRFVNFLDHFDREAMAPTGNFAWNGWRNAILYLGLTSFEVQVRIGWAVGRFPVQSDPDKQEYFELLDYVAAHPGGSTPAS